jgi:putative restriction endonuclease
VIAKQRDRQAKGEKIAFIGFFNPGDVFVAWDPRYVLSSGAKKTGSVYARQSQRSGVLTYQAAIHEFISKRLREKSRAIALPSSVLGFYLENIEHFHALTTERAIIELVSGYTQAISKVRPAAKGIVSTKENGKREKLTYERTAYPRDPLFTKTVLDAYDQTCCVCNRQLGIIQAAHIIPHSIDDSPSDITNGIALCIEHHRLYDDALLLPGPRYRLVFNASRAKYLEQTGQSKGLAEIKKYKGKSYAIPNDPAKQPQEEYLRRGLKLRLGS